MAILVGLILALLTLVFVLYPFFAPQRLSVSVRTKAPLKRDADDEIEKQIMDRRNLAHLFCSQCGAKNPRNARFCAKCGANISKGMKNELNN